jgi:hypothetical protein
MCVSGESTPSAVPPPSMTRSLSRDLRRGRCGRHRVSSSAHLSCGGAADPPSRIPWRHHSQTAFSQSRHVRNSRRSEEPCGGIGIRAPAPRSTWNQQRRTMRKRRVPILHEMEVAVLKRRRRHVADIIKFGNAGGSWDSISKAGVHAGATFPPGGREPPAFSSSSTAGFLSGGQGCLLTSRRAGNIAKGPGTELCCGRCATRCELRTSCGVALAGCRSWTV